MSGQSPNSPDLKVHHLRQALVDSWSSRLPPQRAKAVSSAPTIPTPKKRRPWVYLAGRLNGELLDLSGWQSDLGVSDDCNLLDDRCPRVFACFGEVVALAAPCCGAAVGLHGFLEEEDVRAGEVGDVDVWDGQ
jgi:hypothetical protein